MQTEEFVNRVAQHDGVADEPTARRVSLATVEALCLHLSDEQSRQMISQLPSELSAAANEGRQQATDPNTQVPLDDFYQEVAVRADMSANDVVAPVKAVIAVFGKALTQGEFVDVTFDLPPDLNSLLAS